MEDDFVAWPFPVGASEEKWSEQERDFIAFMRTAYAGGFRPRHRHETLVEAGDPGGRYITLVWRGRTNGWEVLPWNGQSCEQLGPHFQLSDSACVCVRPPFR